MVLLIERDGPVAVVTLNRPEAMNALSRELRAAIARAFKELDHDESVRAIVLTGAGKAFTAGLDLKELASGGRVVEDANPTDHDRDPVRALTKCRKPIIGAINGAAITGGFEIALACDILYASTNARFADTHARVGILPGWGLSQKLSRLVGIHRAKEISLSGNFIDAETARDWGLVNRVFEPAELLPAAIKLAQDIATVPADKVEAYKRLIDDGFGMKFEKALKYETKFTASLNAAVTADSIAEARETVMARGRKQK
ncbi:MAG: enoyl-CoA hydratase [Hydrogenophilaceae bacterium]|jgi:enoyl-CoA hydratase|nr:enoyl-CoA hydratase [Hydrogenophilaceae bacterium]